MKRPGLTIAARFAITSVLLLIFAGLGLTALRSPTLRLEGLIATGAAVGGAVATFAVAVRLVRRPIREVTRAALSMATGDLYDRARVRGDDEIATLADALNRLAGDLSETIATLRGERDLLAGILDGMVEGVLVVDANDKIVLANRALQGLTMAFEDAIGKLVLEVIRNAALKEALDAAQASNEPVVREIELGRLRPRKLLVRVSRLPGKRSGTIAVFHDVTDLRRLETIRTDFVANVSHELRTPVTAISTAAETLLGGALDDPDEAAEFMDVIDRHAKRLRQLVDDLLDLAKLESKSFRLVLADLEVSPIINHVATLMADPARRRNVAIRIEPPGPRREPLRARIDRRALEQVLLNLLDNAIKYAGEGAQVTVRSRPLEDRVEISVTDDGAGISPLHLGRVFERFYRVDTGRSRELGGTGLGLAIVKHLVELMGGKIEVASEPGKGASFTICLHPASSPSSERPPG